MEGKLIINGQIGSFDGVQGVELVDIISQVKKQPDATSFRVYINSEGGFVDVGFDIFNYLRSLGLPITTVGNGLVASIATVIFMAGDKRVVREGNMFMIHLPMGRAAGTADEIAGYAEQIKAVENKVVDFYVERFGISKEAIEPLLKNETWLTEAQLKELGITTMEAINVDAVAKINTNKKPNEMKDKNKNSILKDIFKMLEGLGDAPKNKVLLTADLKEVKFPELEETAVVNIDDRATVEDKPASGDILLQDGRVLTFEAGKLKGIKEKADVESEELETIKADLAAMKAQFEAEKAAKEAAEVAKTAVETAMAALQAKADTQAAVIAKIKALEGNDDGTGNRGGNGGNPPKEKSRFELAVASLKK